MKAFILDLPKYFKNLSFALNSKNYEALGIEICEIKGKARFFGGDCILKACISLLTILRDNEKDSSTEIEVSTARVLNELLKLRLRLIIESLIEEDDVALPNLILPHNFELSE